MKYLYDNNGNVTSITNAENISVTATYDNLNRIVKRDYSDSSMPDVGFFYDGKGLPTEPNDSLGQTTAVKSSVSETYFTSFDELSRVLTHEQRTTAGQIAETEDPYETVYTYSLSGAVETETYPSGRVITHDYDEDGILDLLSGTKPGQTGPKTYLSNIRYNTSGNIEKMMLGNGRWETAEFNSRQQITQIGLGYSENDSNLLNIDYEYGTVAENNGSLKKQTIDYTGLDSPIEQIYTYDALNRLQSAEEKYNSGASQSWKQTFSYDRYGNRTFETVNTTTLTVGQAKVENPTIDSSTNRITKDQDGGGDDYGYDKNGNVTLDAENKQYVYDAENRLKEFFRPSSSTPDATYEYDGNGKRVRKTADGVETIFVYNAGGQLVAEYSTQISTTPEVSYLTADHLGSPRIVTDALGNVRSRHDYMAFGDEVTDTVGMVAGRSTGLQNGTEDDVRKQYTGYERDDESGLDYAQARYYSSLHGRYTSVDPLTASANVKNPQTFNRYSYVLNSPYKFTDPLGLIPQKSDSSELKCNLVCRAQNGTATKTDIARLAYHIQNQTAIGMTYLNATSNSNQQNQNGGGSSESSSSSESDENSQSGGASDEPVASDSQTESAGESESDESFDNLNAVLNRIAQLFAKGATTVTPNGRPGKIEEELTGLKEAVARVFVEAYRVYKKALEKRRFKGGSQAEFNRTMRSLKGFVSRNVSYISNKYTAPRRYMKIKVNGSGNIVTVRPSKSALTRQVRGVFNNIARAARGDFITEVRASGRTTAE